MIGMKEHYNIYPVPDKYIELLMSGFLNIEHMMLENGITLLGSRMGYGKTSTANAMMDKIEKTPELAWIQIAYLHNAELRLNEISFVDRAKELMAEYKQSKLLVVIDQIDSLDSMKAAILLAKSGYSVFGLVTTGMSRSVSTVLSGAVSYLERHEASIMASQLLEQLRLTVFQSDNCPMTCTYIELNKNKHKELVETLNNKGMDYLLKEVIDADPNVVNIEYDYLYIDCTDQHARRLKKELDAEQA